VVGAAVSLAVAEGVGAGVPVAVGVGDVGVGELSVAPPLQAARVSTATEASVRARNLNLLTL